MEVLRSILQRLGPLVSKNGNFCGAFRRGWVHLMLNVETIAEHYAEAGSIEKLNLDCKESVIVQTLFVYKAIKSF